MYILHLILQKRCWGIPFSFPKRKPFLLCIIYIYSAFGPLKEVFGEFIGSNEHKLCFRPGIQDVMCAEFFGGCESVVNGFRWGLMQNLSHV